MSRPGSCRANLSALFMDTEDQHEAVDGARKRVRRWAVVGLSCTIAALLFASVNYVLIEVLENVRPKPHVLLVWWATRFYLWAALSPAVVRLLKRWPLQP